MSIYVSRRKMVLFMVISLFALLLLTNTIGSPEFPTDRDVVTVVLAVPLFALLMSYAAMRFVWPRRVLRLDSDGVEIARLFGSVKLPWGNIAAVGNKFGFTTVKAVDTGRTPHIDSRVSRILKYDGRNPTVIAPFTTLSSHRLAALLSEMLDSPPRRVELVSAEEGPGARNILLAGGLLFFGAGVSFLGWLSQLASSMETMDNQLRGVFIRQSPQLFVLALIIFTISGLFFAAYQVFQRPASRRWSLVMGILAVSIAIPLLYTGVRWAKVEDPLVSYKQAQEQVDFKILRPSFLPAGFEPYSKWTTAQFVGSNITGSAEVRYAEIGRGEPRLLDIWQVTNGEAAAGKWLDNAGSPDGEWKRLSVHMATATSIYVLKTRNDSELQELALAMASGTKVFVSGARISKADLLKVAGSLR